MLARVFVDQALNANQNPSPPRSIPQRIQPVTIDVGLLNTHLQSVAYQLRPSRPTTTVGQRLVKHPAIGD